MARNYDRYDRSGRPGEGAAGRGYGGQEYDRYPGHGYEAYGYRGGSGDENDYYEPTGVEGGYRLPVGRAPDRYPREYPTREYPTREYPTRDYPLRGPSRSHLRCREIMTPAVVTCTRETPIRDVARMMRDEDIGAVPVLANDRRVQGIITDRDIVVRGLTTDKGDTELTAGDCMSDDVYTAHPNDRVVDVISTMGDHQVRRIPIVDSRGRLTGVVSMADIAKASEHDAELAEALEDISKPSSWFGRLTHFLGAFHI